MQIMSSLDRLMFGSSPQAERFCSTFAEVELYEAPLLSTRLTATACFTFVMALKLVLSSQPGVANFFFKTFFLGLAVSLILLLVLEVVEALRSRKVRFLHRASVYVHPHDKGEEEHFEAIDYLKAKVNRTRQNLLTWLGFFCSISFSVWRVDDFWSGLWQTIWYQDIQRYHFTTMPDLLTVLAVFGLGMLWFIKVTAPWYWLRQLEINVRELKVSK